MYKKQTKKYITLFLLSVIFTFSCKPVGPPILQQPVAEPIWSVDTGMGYDPTYRNLVVDSSGNSYVFAQSNVNIKFPMSNYDSAGNLAWVISPNDTTDFTKYEILFDKPNGNFYIYGNDQFFGLWRLRKYSMAGVEEWFIERTGTLEQYQVTLLPSQGVIVSGLEISSSGIAGEYDLVHEQYDSFGKMLTANTFPAATIHNQNRIASATIGSDGNLRLALRHTEKCYNAQADLSLLIIDSLGNIASAANPTIFNGLSPDPNASCEAKIVTHNHGSITNTYIMTANYLFKYGDVGNKIWEYKLQGKLPIVSYAELNVDAAGDLMFRYGIELWFMEKISSTGQRIWGSDAALWRNFKTLNGDLGINGKYAYTHLGPDNSIYLAAAVRDEYRPIEVAKISYVDGSLLWVREAAKPQMLDKITSINVDANGSVYLIGSRTYETGGYSGLFAWSGIFVFDTVGNPLSTAYFKDKIRNTRVDALGNVYTLQTSKITGPSLYENYGNYYLEKLSF